MGGLLIWRVCSTFLFKDDRNAHRLELTDVNQSIHGVSGEAGDGLGDDDIDFALFTELNHLFEVLTLLSGSACDTLIGCCTKRTNKFVPYRIPGVRSPSEL